MKNNLSIRFLFSIFILLFFSMDMVHAQDKIWQCKFKLPDNDKGKKILAAIVGYELAEVPIYYNQPPTNICEGYNCKITWVIKDIFVPLESGVRFYQPNVLGEYAKVFTFRINDYTWDHKVKNLYTYKKEYSENNSRVLGGTKINIVAALPNSLHFGNRLEHYITVGYDIQIIASTFPIAKEDITRNNSTAIKYDAQEFDKKQFKHKANDKSENWYMYLTRVKSNEKSTETIELTGKEVLCGELKPEEGKMNGEEEGIELKPIKTGPTVKNPAEGHKN
ncbi:MAG: hypothetical protein K0R94_783 [Burkholderiales bacterium]|nr:hypothetical protein [Burkholderiales bacterium]